MSDIKSVPDYVLQYMAPMQCGEKERAELIRRQNEIVITRKS